MASANYSDITGRVIGHWSGGGGGGSLPVMALYSGNDVTVVDSGTGTLTWDTLSDGTDLLDRSVLDTPTFLAAGTYAITVPTFAEAPLTAGGRIVLGVGVFGVHGTSTQTSATGGFANCGVTLVAVVDAGDQLTATVTNLDGAASRDFPLAGATIVKLA